MIKAITDFDYCIYSFNVPEKNGQIQGMHVVWIEDENGMFSDKQQRNTVGYVLRLKSETKGRMALLKDGDETLKE